MPVLSPHRSSASALSSSYRSTLSSSSIDRPYYSSASSYNPRITSYSERYSTRSYTDADGRRIYSRSGSITEDGITTRFKEESREGSVRRDSLSRDFVRENSVLDLRRDSSLSRGEPPLSRLSALSVAESVAEMRNRYSPANYVPAIQRKNENISRSKSINDIGLPPVERGDTKTIKKKVNDGLNYNNCLGLTNSNNTNTNAVDNIELCQDDNGNRASVADLRKKFDVKANKNAKASTNHDGLVIEGNKFTNNERASEKVIKTKKDPVASRTNSLARNVNKKIKSSEQPSGNNNENGSVCHEPKQMNNVSIKFDKKIDSNETKCNNKSDAKSTENIPKLNVSNDLITQNNGTELGGALKTIATSALLESGPDQPVSNGVLSVATTNHTNHYPSYIFSKDFQRGDNQSDDDSESAKAIDDNNSEMDNHGHYYHQRITTKPNMSHRSYMLKPMTRRHVLDLPTTSRLNKTGTSTSNNIRERNSVEKDRYDDDRSYDRPALTSHSIKQQGLNGLKNIGNTCFMNSVIQCLSNTRPLLEYVKKDLYNNDINTSISSMKGALIKAFGQVLKELWSEDCSDRVVNTVALKSQIQRFAPRFMGYAQQDAQEFLRYLLEGLHEDVNRVTEKPKAITTEIDEKLSDAEKAAEAWQRYLRMDNSKIVDIFVGQLKSTLRCTHCGHCSVTFDPFWDLSLPLPQRAGQLRLSQCLEYFTREETLDGDEKPTCSKCKERRKCTKSFSIQKFPKILVIHLKRFSPTERFRGKLSVTVDVPLEGLDMRQYAADSSPSECRYNLYAISNHSGTTYSGHYTAHCRHPYSLAWHEYNDSRVSSISAKSVVSGEAYVLFYELESQKSHL